jgi:hypothetical protein
MVMFLDPRTKGRLSVLTKPDTLIAIHLYV